MAETYPHETIYRAFMLFMDYIPTKKIVSVLAQTHGGKMTPTAKTILKWRDSGEGTNGVSWNHIREITDQVRGKASSDLIRGKYERQGKGPSQYADWAENTMSDLERAQQKLMRGIDIGYVDMKMSDLPQLIKSRQLLEGLATSRIEHQSKHVEVLGRIVYAAGLQVISDNRGDSSTQQVVGAMVDLIAGEFTRFISFGGEPDKYEIETGRSVNLGLLQQGIERARETEGDRPVQPESTRETSNTNTTSGLAESEDDGLENSDDRGEGER